MIQKTEVYAYLHRMEAGMLTISPRANLFNQLRIPASDVEFEVLVNEPRKVLLRITEEQARFYGFKPAETDKTMPAIPTSYSVGEIPTHVLVDELIRKRGSDPQALIRVIQAVAPTVPLNPSMAMTSDVAAMAAKFAPDQYSDESQALHTAHNEDGKHTGVDYELHRGPAPSILDKLPNVSRPISDTLKKIGRSFE